MIVSRFSLQPLSRTLVTKVLTALCLVVVLLGTFYNACAQDGGATNKQPVSNERASVEVAARKAAMEKLKADIVAAHSSDAKRDVIRQFQSVSLSSQEERAPASQDKTPLQRLAELKVEAQGNAERLAQLDKAEARLKSMETMKAKLAEAESATGEEKRLLMEEFRREGKKLAEQRRVEMEPADMGAETAKGQDRALPPQMAALKAKSETRRQEMEEFKEALAKSLPEERKKLMEDWRAKRMSEATERPTSPTR